MTLPGSNQTHESAAIGPSKKREALFTLGKRRHAGRARWKDDFKEHNIIRMGTTFRSTVKICDLMGEEWG